MLCGKHSLGIIKFAILQTHGLRRISSYLTGDRRHSEFSYTLTNKTIQNRIQDSICGLLCKYFHADQYNSIRGFAAGEKKQEIKQYKYPSP